MTTNVAKNTLYSSVNIYVEYFIGFAISIFIAKALGPEAYGSYAYFIKVAAIAIIFVSSGVNTGVVKFVAEARAKNDPELVASIHAYFSKIQKLLILILCGLLLALFLWKPEWLLGEDLKVFVFFLVAAVAFKSVHMFRVSNFKGHERFDFLAFTVLIVSPINLLIVLYAYFNGFAQSFYLYCYVFVCFLYSFISGLYLKKLKADYPKPVRLSDAYKKRANHHLKVVSFNAVIASLGVGQCEMIFLKQMVDASSVAFFSVANSISSAAMLLVPGVYSAVLFPVIARAVADIRLDPAKKIEQSGRYLFMLGVMVAAPTFLFADVVIESLYGREFISAGWVLSIFITVGVLRVYVQPISAYLMSVDKQSTLLRLSILNMALSLVLTYFFILGYGFSGAVYSFVVVRVIMTLMLVYLGWRQLQLLPDFGRFFLMLFVAALAGVATHWVLGDVDGLLSALLGYPFFAALYVLFVYVLGGLTADDYGIADRYAKAAGGRLGRVLVILASLRLGSK